MGLLKGSNTVRNRRDDFSVASGIRLSGLAAGGLEVRPTLFPGCLTLSLTHMALLIVGGGLVCGVASATHSEPEQQGFAVELSLRCRWLDATGKVRADRIISTDVAITATSALIQSSSLDTNVAFSTWGSSPYRDGEWIFGFHTHAKNSRVSTVIVDDKPTMTCGDLSANLARILYVPEGHPARGGVDLKEWMYLHDESGPYSPKELEFRMTQEVKGGTAVPVRILAITPDYFYAGPDKEKTPFRGQPNVRTLWELDIANYTNWLGRLLPSRFHYVRYQDAHRRVAEEDLVPIAVCEGTLEAIKPALRGGFASRLDADLTVIDYRPRKRLSGQPAVYQSSPGGWPEIGSEAYDEMVSTNLARILTDSDTDVSLRSGRRWVVSATLAGITLVPILAMLLYRKFGNRRSV